MNRSNNHKKQLFNIVKTIVILLIVLIIVSCPEPMSDNLLAEVDDVAAPVITITSPDLSVQNFIESAVTITGTIKDFSDSAGKILGSVVSASYADKYGFLGISDVVSIGSDGSFTINFSSVTLLDTFTIVITVTDWNGNTSTKDVTYWKDSSGPYIVVTDHDSADYNVYSSALSTPYTISGLIGTDSIKLRYDIEWSGTNVLDATPTTIDYSAGTFSFDFIPTSYSGTLTFWLKATDDNTNTTNKLFSLTDDPVKPIITSHSFPSDNTTLTATLSEGIYTSTAGATGTNIVTEADFDLKLDGVPLTWSFSTSPAEGETSLNISFSGIPATPDGSEVLTFAPKSDEVFDRVGNPADPAVFLITENLHDKQVPTVSSVTQTDATHVVVVYSEEVNETQAETYSYYSNPDTPSIPATNAVLAGGNTVTVTFGSTIDPGDGLNIDGGVINDLDGNPLTVVTGHPIIDGVAPTITSIDSTESSGPFNDTDIITIDVHFDETVTLVGTATMNLDSGGTASCSDTSGTYLTFTYNIQTGEGSSDLDVISITDGTIQDGSGNDLNRTLPASSNLSDNENIVVDAIDPTITSIDSTESSGPFNDTDIITIDVHFDETVTLVGTATMNLDSGGTASCSDTSGTYLTFTYNIQTGEGSSDLDVISITDGTIQDGSGNDLNRTLPASSNLSDNENIVVDAIDPTITSIDSTESSGPFNDTYTITIDVHFDETVTLVGTATMNLDSGGTASCSDTSGTYLTFTYNIQAGEGSSDLDVISITGGTIQDGSGNDLNRALPASSNLSDNENIEIDTTAPELVSVVLADRSPISSPGAGNGDTITFTFNDEIDPSSINANTGDTGELGALMDKICASGYGLSNLNPSEDSHIITFSGGMTVVITLAGLEADDIGSTEPSGTFTPLSTLTDLAGNVIDDTVAKVLTSSSWDSTAPVTTADPSGGTYSSGVAVPVSLSSETGAIIYYTTDGIDPTTSSTQYSSTFDVTGTATTVTLKFFAVDAYNNREEHVTSVDFTFN